MKTGKMTENLSTVDLLRLLDDEYEQYEADDGDFSSGSDEEYQLPDEEELDDTIEDDASVSSGSDGETEDGDFTDVDPLFVSKDNTVWSSVPCQHQSTRARNSNIITLRPGKLTLVFHCSD